MEQFSLEKYLENPNRKVVTRDGRVVKILDIEFESGNGNKSILAKCIYNNKAAVYVYTTDGKANNMGETENDLFFAEEEEKLTEFELRLLSSLDYTRKFRQNYSYEHMLKITKDIAKELLDLARKEIFKDLPRYKKAEESKVLDWVVKITENGNIIFSDVIYKGEYFIMLQSLKTLPKEE